ncbi:hypothetical protein SDC9_208584 [bioreactor metagenome]|uniref:Uncharacterized protein n=1 Tax=bioreactor metagenome TaxID=1076179 RepID=A0A645JB55_9ZZZZ
MQGQKPLFDAVSDFARYFRLLASARHVRGPSFPKRIDLWKGQATQSPDTCLQVRQGRMVPLCCGLPNGGAAGVQVVRCAGTDFSQDPEEMQ